MYSNGVPEIGSADDENLNVFSKKLLKTTERLRSSRPATLRQLFECNETLIIQVENWLFRAAKDGSELHVTNLHADQKTILRGQLAGFEFESNKNEIVQFLATSDLGGEMQMTWEGVQCLLKSSNDADAAEALKLRHIKRLQRLEEPALASKPPPSATKPQYKSGIPVSLKTKKTDPTPNTVGSSLASSSARLSALQQYLTAVSSKSVQVKNSQLKQNIIR